MITDEQIARIFNKHGANFFAGARELIALAQQEPAQAVPQHVIDAANRIPQNVIETPQAVPVAWMVTRAMAEPTLEWAKPKKHSCLRYEPLYTHPAPLDDDTRKRVLELCELTLINGGPAGMVTAAMVQRAKQIRKRLEAGE